MVTEIEILPSGKVRLNSWSGRKIRLSSVFLTNRVLDPLFSFRALFPGSEFFIETRPEPNLAELHSPTFRSQFLFELFFPPLVNNSMYNSISLEPASTSGLSPESNFSKRKTVVTEYHRYI